jgi:hypothetical protein
MFAELTSLWWLYDPTEAEDGGSTFLRNVDIYLQVHTALQPKRPILTRSLEHNNLICWSLKKL